MWGADADIDKFAAQGFRRRCAEDEGVVLVGRRVGGDGGVVGERGGRRSGQEASCGVFPSGRV
jgi:hypothetical protein